MPHLPLFSPQRLLTTVAPRFKFEDLNHTKLSVLQSCTSMEEFKQVHAQLITTDQIKDTFIATKMVESYAVFARNINYACRVFDGIDDPDSYSWTTMIRGFVEMKDPGKAIEVYGLMRSKGVKLNRFTILFVLKACGLKPGYEEGKIVHGKVVKLGFYFDVFIRNALIHAYSKCGDTCGGRKLFDEVPTSNVVNWNTMITGYFGCGEVENGRRLFDEMPEKNVDSWKAVISGYCKVGHVGIARSLFDAMPERDLVSWGMIISGYVQNRRAVEALELFNKMLFSGYRPDSVMITSILAACAQIGALDMGRWIHAYMNRKKLTNDIILSTSLVDMYAKCGCIDTSFQLFCCMPQKNLCSWNAMLSGFASHGHGSTVLKLLKEMESAGEEPNDVTFVAVLSACSHVGSVDEGWKQFSRMSKQFGITPKIEHYGCMVDILGRVGLIDDAKELIKTMPMEPNIVIWGALLNACKIHGHTNIGEDIMGSLQKLASGNGGCYTLLSNIFAGMDQWNEVEKTRRMMREEGAEKKIPGCSLIEVNGVVHEFFVDDRSLMRSEMGSIRAILLLLMKEDLELRNWDI